MHASFSMRGKSYKMIQSSSRINDENFLLVVKKKCRIIILKGNEHTKMASRKIHFGVFVNYSRCRIYGWNVGILYPSHKMRTYKRPKSYSSRLMTLEETWIQKGLGTQIAFSSSLYNATLLTQIFFWRLISEWCRSKRDEILTVYKMNFASMYCTQFHIRPPCQLQSWGSSFSMCTTLKIQSTLTRGGNNFC